MLDFAMDTTVFDPQMLDTDGAFHLHSEADFRASVRADIVMKTIPVKTTYLQMLAPKDCATPPPCDGISILWAEKPTLSFYRFLYESVGKDWTWVDRLLMTDDQLRAIIHDELVEIHVLYVRGTPAGFAELDRRVSGEVELAYFGLMPEFQGNGLGRYFLHWAVGKAWSHDPGRVWVHTCELDHPAALPLYQEAGFEVFDCRLIDQRIPN